MSLFSLYHFMPVPIVGNESQHSFSWNSLIGLLVWFVPFAAAYFWHLYHDHKHSHYLERKLDELTELLKKILEKNNLK